jgi:hypothetical protein
LATEFHAHHTLAWEAIVACDSGSDFYLLWLVSAGNPAWTFGRVCKHELPGVGYWDENAPVCCVI